MVIFNALLLNDLKLLHSSLVIGRRWVVQLDLKGLYTNSPGNPPGKIRLYWYSYWKCRSSQCKIRYLHFLKKKCLFQFKYFNDTNKPKMDKPSTADLTKPDGNLELNIGKINIVFLYRFITELLVSVSYFEEHVSVVESFNDRNFFLSIMSL